MVEKKASDGALAYCILKDGSLQFYYMFALFPRSGD